MRLPPQSIGPDEVHVWRLAADDPVDTSAFAALLSPEEQARHARFLHARTKREFLLARGLVRTVLAAYTGVPAAELRFEASGTGKPTLASAELHFNLSHSHGLVVCAVSRACPLGVDVEDAGRSLEYLDLAERYFAPAEVAHLRGLEGDALREAFFAVWTLKEAFVKAIGQGLSFPLETFAFALEQARCVGFQAPASLPGRAWQVEQFRPTPRHLGALVVEHAGPPLRVAHRALLDE